MDAIAPRVQRIWTAQQSRYQAAPRPLARVFNILLAKEEKLMVTNLVVCVVDHGVYPNSMSLKQALDLH